MGDLIGIAAGLAGGWIGKKIGKSQKVGGRKPWQKILAPVGAVAGAAALTAITGDEQTGRALLEAAGQAGGSAILMHSVAKNAAQFLRG